MRPSSLHAELTVSHAALLLAVVAAGALSLGRMTALQAAQAEDAVRHVKALELVVSGIGRASETSRLTYEAALAPSAEAARERLAALDESRAAGAVLAATVRAALPGERDRAAFTQVEEACEDYGRALAPVREAALAGRREEAARLATRELVPLRVRVQEAWKRFGAFEREELRADAEAASAAHGRARAVLAAVVVALAAAGAALAFRVTRSISRDVLACAAAARRVAAGDLRVDPAVTRDDELGSLERSMAVMTERLREMISRTGAASRALAQESARNWAAARGLLAGTTTQRATASELAARLTDMSASLASAGRVATAVERLAEALPSLEGAGRLAGDLRRELDSCWAGVAQVTRGVYALEDAAKRNAALAGQLWEDAEAAAAEARALQDLVGAFRTRPDPAEPAPDARRPDPSALAPAREG